MKWLCQLKGWEKNKNPHWFDFHGPPTPFPMIDPGLVPIQKDNKNTNQSSHSYWGARAPETILLQMRRNREKKKKERREDEPSVCPGSAWTLVSHRIHLCSFVGAKYNSMGLLTFQYFSLTSSREKEPFRTCEERRDTVTLKKCTYDMFIKIGVQWYS